MIKTTAGYAYKSLVGDYKNKYLIPFLMIIKKGTTNFFKHDAEEFAYVLKGCVHLYYESKVYVFNKGDSFYLVSRIKHRFTNKGPGDIFILIVDYNY